MSSMRPARNTAGARRLVVLGDALLDRDLDGQVERLCPDAPVPVVDEPVTRSRPGGAGLAALLASKLAAPDGGDVTLITALAADEAGEQLAGLLTGSGVEVVPLPLDGATPQKIRVRAGGRCLLRMDHACAPRRIGDWPSLAACRIAEASAVLVADYGRGMARLRGAREALAAAAARVPIVWDPHPRGPEPVPGLRLVTPNAAEADRFSGVARAQAHAEDGAGQSLRAAAAAARLLQQRWRASGVSITLGARGALLWSADGTPLMAPSSTPAPPTVDACGAGDCYAAAAAFALAEGALLSEAVIAAVAAASSFVGRGGVSALDVGIEPAAPVQGPSRTDAVTLIQRIRSRGGVVVATGGCFDLLHAGHVQMLAAARALGDCLIVCLNSDASVARLKGGSRPVVPAVDRAAVLLALEHVDAVVVFDESTPEAILDRLRPDIWAKGADYAAGSLPEAPLVESWGGQAVVLPYLAGRSTTSLIQSFSAQEASPYGR
jgi:rfaE bifunctional protein nucleotidyltransferase chain/domain/rfaE bifunctional protein kinase chain/domain